MKHIVVCLLVMLLLFCGCTAVTSQDEIPNDTHADHHVAQTRKQQNFFLEAVDVGELTVLYLSYNEPDGCVTQLCELEADPFHQPELVCQGSTFYYICYDEAISGQVESDGYLYSVGFDGEQKCLKASKGVMLGHIVRTDESYIYCVASDAKTYIKADLALTQWSESTQEETLGEKK